MNFDYWAPVPPGTALSALVDTAVLIYRPGSAHGIVATVAYDPDYARHRVTWAATSNLDSTTFVDHDGSTDIHVVAGTLARVGPSVAHPVLAGPVLPADHLPRAR